MCIDTQDTLDDSPSGAKCVATLSEARIITDDADFSRLNRGLSRMTRINADFGAF